MRVTEAIGLANADWRWEAPVAVVEVGVALVASGEYNAGHTVSQTAVASIGG